MAFSVSFNVADDALQPEGRNAFADAFGWEGATDPRGATKQQFLEHILKRYYKDIIRSERRRTAESAVAPVED